MPTLIERYMQGDHQEVWDEIRSKDGISIEEQDEIWLVATETMKRVARNVIDMTGQGSKVKGQFGGP